jgi:glycosyltransferase involved in cell wall biosynthesis
VKVIQLLPDLNSGGVERGTLEVAAFLASRGHQSLVVSSGGRLVKRLQEEGSQHITLPVHKKSLFSLLQVAPLRKLFRDEAPDIIHVRSRLPAWLTWLAWKKMDPQTRPRLVTTTHGLHSVNRYSRIMTCGERLIGVSECVRRYLLENYPQTNPELIRIIPRGVDPAYFAHGYQPPPEWLKTWHAEHPQFANKFLITLPGRITAIKGQDHLIKIVARLRKAGVPAHGLILGDTHPKRRKFGNTLREMIVREGVAEHLTIISHRNDVREILAMSAVVLSLTHIPESFGRVTLEALSMGRPVAAYAHGGVKDQMQKFFPEGAIAPDDLDACAQLLESWHRQGPPTLQPPRDHPYTLHAMLESTLAVYEELLSSR